MNGPVVVVTGGSGFLGERLIAQLLEEGGPIAPREVRVFDPRPPRADRVVHVRGDVRSKSALRDAVRGADLVFHCAASVDWGRSPDALLHAINVGGTENVIDACRHEGVGALVHTSTLDVVHGGGPIRDAHESMRYPERFPNGYCRTKALGEQRALAANGASLRRDASDGRRELRTVALRPCFVFGEGDPYHIQPLLDMARRGRLIRIGDGRARCQWSYVGNVAHAHVLAGALLLREASASAAGEAFFVTDGEPENFFAFVSPFVEAAGHRMPSWSLPAAPLSAIGGLFEGAARIARPFVRLAPTITRSAVAFVTEDFTVRSDKAERLLGYSPRFSREEAIHRTRAHYAALRS